MKLHPIHSIRSQEKYSPSTYIDLGQGLVDLIEELNKKNFDEKQTKIIAIIYPDGK